LLAGVGIALVGVAVYSKAIRADTVTLEGSGMRMTMPSAWDGRTYENPTGLEVLQAASVPLAPDDDDVGNKTVRRLATGDVFISVFFWPDWPPKGGSGANTALALPISIGRADFGGFGGQVAPSMAQRVGEVDGKLVQVRVCFGTPRPIDALIARANTVLKTFALT
jgi:hypothetical protein